MSLPEVVFLLWVTCVPLAAILSLVLLHSPVSRFAVTVLAALVALQCAVQTVTYLKVAGYAPQWPVIYRLTFPLKLTSLTLVYFYFAALLNPRRGWRDFSRWHWLPVAVGVVYYLAFWVLPVPTALFQDSDAFAWEKWLRQVFCMLVFIPYFVVIVRLFRAAVERQRFFRSDLDTLLFGWSRVVLALAFCALALSALDVLAGPFVRLWALDSTFNLAGFSVIVFLGLRYSAIYDEPDPEPAVLLTDSQLTEWKAKLDQHLVRNRMFVKPGLRLAELSEGMGARPYFVSQVIRQGFNSNFYDLVNALRIDEAKRLLSNAQGVKVLSVAFDCGFGSKSAFNEVFRRQTGMTPSEYRRSVQAN